MLKKQLQVEFGEHHKNKELACCFTNCCFTSECYDLQKVLPPPCSQVRFMYYKCKLEVYNFMSYDSEQKQGNCYMWHEAIAHRGSNEIGTCVYDFLQDQATNGVKDVAFYSDNCGGQNKNQYIAVMYAKAVVSTSLERITHNFLEKGHTQNEGDSMHSRIEQAIGKTPVFVPSQYYVIARGAKKTGKSYEVKEMETDDFVDWHQLASVHFKTINMDDAGNRVSWKSIRAMEFRKESPNKMFFKYHYDQDYSVITFSKPGRRKRVELKDSDLKKAYDRPPPISSAKFKDLASLCMSQAIPKIYRNFFETLPHEHTTK